jgi:hypothetical protein
MWTPRACFIDTKPWHPSLLLIAVWLYLRRARRDWDWRFVNKDGDLINYCLSEAVALRRRLCTCMQYSHATAVVVLQPVRAVLCYPELCQSCFLALSTSDAQVADAPSAVRV